MPNAPPSLPNPIPIRDALLRERGWMLAHVFDTNAHEPHKDVCLIRTAAGDAVLRIGERRPEHFFPNGYRGARIVIPRLIESSASPLFEVEELLPGTLIVDHDPHPTATHIVRPDLLDLLIDGAWEVLEAFATQPLIAQWDREAKLEKHLRVARRLLSDVEQRRIDAVLAASAEFWQPTHPAKWKYAVDNTIRMPDGQLGLIDLARVGMYFWGYDLGWIVWPRWFHLPTTVLREPTPHLLALEDFVTRVVARAPTRERQHEGALRSRMHLVLLERTIGTWYDVAERIPHTRRMTDNPERQAAFTDFLHALTAWVLDRCDPRANA